VLLREGEVGEFVVLCLVYESPELGEALTQLVGDGAPLDSPRLLRFPREGSSDRG
jgi:hypothetical protein